MAKPLQSTTVRAVAALLVVCGIIGLAGWRLIHPASSHVTIAQIRAVLPPEVLETVPEDSKAEERMDSLLTLVKGIDSEAIEGFLPPTSYSSSSSSGYPPGSPPHAGAIAKPLPTEHDRYVLAVAFWKDRPHLIDQLQSLARTGPVQSRPSRTQFSGDSNVKSVAKALVTSAFLYARQGDFAASTRMLLIATELADDVLGGNGTFMDYLVGGAIQAMVMAGIHTATAVADYPVTGLQQLLRAVAAAPRTDTSLRLVLRAEFQMNVLPALPDQKRVWQKLVADSGAMDDEDSASEEPLGTYDAMETATIYSRCVAIQMKNALLPLSRLDPADQKLQDRADDGLPQPVDESKLDEREKSLAKFKYRLEMNTTHNSLGRLLISELMYGGKTSVILSCRRRSIQNATRVLLASKLYRASHGGKLPGDKTGFLPLLGSWPQDPFNGKELIYDAKAEKVYSVGENLIDDHGDIVAVMWKTQPDVGLSLKIGD